MMYPTAIVLTSLSLSLSLVKQVFADMEFVGWYTTGDTPSTDDIDLHEQVCTL